MEREPCASVLLRHGINMAAVARRAVDEVPFGIWFQVLHLHELLVDGKMHLLHIASAPFRPLVVLRKVVLHMAMLAIHPQRAAVSLVHDQQQPPGWSLLQKI